MNLTPWGYRLIQWAPVTKATKLRWRHDFTNWHWARDMKVAEKTNDPEHIERGHNEWQFDMAMQIDEEQEFYSKKLLRRARDLRVQVPQYYEGTKLTDFYEEGRINGRIYLSLKGEHAVRAAIREEEEHRAKQRGRWVPYIAALTGLVGAVTGLVAAVDKFGTPGGQQASPKTSATSTLQAPPVKQAAPVSSAK